MYQNKLPSVEKLIQRLNAAERSQQKDIRLSIQEGKELCQELTLMTVKLSQTVQEIHELMVDLKENNSKIEVKVDGGGFGSG